MKIITLSLALTLIMPLMLTEVFAGQAVYDRAPKLGVIRHYEHSRSHHPNILDGGVEQTGEKQVHKEGIGGEKV